MKPETHCAPASTPPLEIAFDNSYARDLAGLYLPVRPSPPPAPRLVRLNAALAEELGLDAAALAGPAGLAMLSGAALPEGAQPIAQAYAGHQFGGFSPQLGDGRALLLGEVIDRHGRRRDIAFKGSGRTPFSRGGDGKAALGPVLREYLIGEAMHALGIPTTRALAAVATGEPVRREVMLPGALLTRVAASHVRVGTFQYFAARQDTALLRRLTDHVIARHDPGLAGHAQPELELLRAVCERQASLIARWMGVGFIHGVMNTDNMTISGETIDYGPCAFMEAYDPQAVFSSIDESGRYAFGNQPSIAQWNLTRLAEALLPLLDGAAEEGVEAMSAVLAEFPARFEAHWIGVVRAKLGLDDRANPEDDRTLVNEFLQLLHEQQVDFTLGFRRLAQAAGEDAESDGSAWRDLTGHSAQAFAPWLARWRERLRRNPGSPTERRAAMDRANPIYIPRNQRVEEALIAAVEHDDLGPFERLLAVLEHPFIERTGDAAFAEPAPAELTAGYRTYCGT